MFRKMLSYTSKGGKALIATATLSFIAAELLWAYFLYLAVSTMSAMLGGAAGGIDQILLWGVILLAAKTAFAILADLTKHCAGFDVTQTVRLKLIHKLKSLSLGFFTNERLGEVSTVIHKDVDALEGYISHFLSAMWSDIAVAVIIGVWLFTKSWLLGLCMVSLLPVAALALFLGLKNAQQAQKANGDNLADMASLFVEYTKGMPLLKAFPVASNCESAASENGAFRQKLDASVTAFGDSSRYLSKVFAAYTGRFAVFFELCSAVLFIVGAFLLQSGNITMSVFLYFIIFSAIFYKPFAKMELYFLEYVKAGDSYRRVASITEAPSVRAPQDPKRPAGFDIAFERVGFSYDETAASNGSSAAITARSGLGEGGFALKDVDFTVREGSLTALVGASGSGKTTVTNLLLRFWDVGSGVIKIGGTDIRAMDYDTLLDSISIVMQNVYLTSGSLLENIAIGKKAAAREEIIAAAKKAQIHDFIAGLPDGYDTLVGENGVGLSGGQKQRLSIARALLKDAPIVVLDEITANVDPLNETKIQRAVSALAQNRTVLVIAHHLRTIRAADQILVFDQGVVTERGGHQDLLARGGLYAALWEAQEKAVGWKIA
ncbi:MAG: ABC transporter ATP-binding protein/permease [Peptococcaceae bacterium]|jgi:ATP-binding cassette subfamily B protein|nr:ABC transporter ATP-binding protein/permease [Peptococcaceae bacterium]